MATSFATGGDVHSSSISGFDPRTVSGCVLWLDAADPNTLFTDIAGTTLANNGNSVARWNDKSISANNATQSTSANRPTIARDSATGLTSMVFNATNFTSINTGSTNLPTGAGADTTFVVTNPINNSSDIIGRQPNGRRFNVNQISPTVNIQIPFGGSTINTGTGPRNTLITSVINNYINSLSVNGGTAVVTDSQSTQGLETTGALFIGSNGGGSGNALTGTISEILVFNRALQNDERQQIEGYLAWKWGLVQNLPTTHPYYYAKAPNSAFQPTSFPSCALWLDAADRNTISSRVSQWSDKSGNGNHATQTTGANQPTINSAGPNGLTTIAFNGTSQFFSLPDSTRLDFPTNDFAIFAMVRVNPATDTSVHNIIVKNNPNTPQWRMSIENRNSQITIFNSSAQSSLAFVSGSSQWTLLNGVVNRTTGNTLFRNGTSVASSASITGSLTNNSIVTIGANSAGNDRFWNSDMGEIIVYSGLPTTTQREQIEGYLAWKWGTVSSLPASHPFRGTQPLGFVPTSISGCQLWLDASDVSTLSLNVTGWNDKSGNNTNLVSNASFLQPTYLSDSRSLNFTAVANTSSTVLENTSVPAITSASITVFGVYRRISQSSNATTFQRLISMSTTDTSDTSAGFNINTAGGSVLRYERADANLQSSVVTLTDNFIITLALNGTSSAIESYAANTQTILFNGSSVGSSTGVGNGTAFNLTRIRLGSATSISNSNIGTSLFNGTISEVLFYSTILTPAQVQQIEGYLAWKWQLQGNLPSSHPFTQANYFFNNTRPLTRYFSPPDIEGCQLWIDAADSSVVTRTDVGTIVSEWRDKSGQGNHATQSTAANRPTYSPINGLEFNGSSSFLTTTSPVTISTIFAVGRNTANRNFMTARTSAGTHSAYYLSFKNDVTFAVSNTSDTVFNVNLSSNTSLNTRYILTGTSSSTSVTADINGGVFTGSQTVTGTLKTPLQTFIGANWVAGNILDYFNGSLNEIIVFNTVLTTEQRRQIEGYLAWKWGLVGSLPSSHPFFLSPPPLTSPTSLSGCQLWLDGADVTQIVTSNPTSSVVTSVADKSGLGNNLTNLGSTITYASTLNSRPILTFPSSGSITGNTLSTTSLTRDPNNFSAFYVCRYPAGTPHPIQAVNFDLSTAITTTITGATNTGTSTPTLTVTSSSGFEIGRYVLISGVTPTTYNQTGLITAIPSSSQITVQLSLAAAPGAHTSGGTIIQLTASQMFGHDGTSPNFNIQNVNYEAGTVSRGLNTSYYSSPTLANNTFVLGCVRQNGVFSLSTNGVLNPACSFNGTINSGTPTSLTIVTLLSGTVSTGMVLSIAGFTSTITITGGSGSTWTITNPASISTTNTFMSTNIGFTALGNKTTGPYSIFGGLQGMDIAEAIVYNSALTDGERQVIEGYLSWKWGIQRATASTNPSVSTTGTSLAYPTTHPYYTIPPAQYLPSVPSTKLYKKPFDPSDLSPVIWIDPQDTNTIEHTSSRITQIRNKGSFSGSLTPPSGISGPLITESAIGSGNGVKYIDFSNGGVHRVTNVTMDSATSMTLTVTPEHTIPEGAIINFVPIRGRYADNTTSVTTSIGPFQIATADITGTTGAQTLTITTQSSHGIGNNQSVTLTINTGTYSGGGGATGLSGTYTTSSSGNTGSTIIINLTASGITSGRMAITDGHVRNNIGTVGQYITQSGTTGSTIKLTSYSNRTTGSLVDFTGYVEYGSIPITSGNIGSTTITLQSVDASSVFTSSSVSGMVTGTPIIPSATGNGLTSGTMYYVFSISSLTFRLASSLQNALAGTSITTTANASLNISATAYGTSVTFTTSINHNIQAGNQVNVNLNNIFYLPYQTPAVTSGTVPNPTGIQFTNAVISGGTTLTIDLSGTTGLQNPFFTLISGVPTYASRGPYTIHFPDGTTFGDATNASSITISNVMATSSTVNNTATKLELTLPASRPNGTMVFGGLPGMIVTGGSPVSAQLNIVANTTSVTSNTFTCTMPSNYPGLGGNTINNIGRLFKQWVPSENANFSTSTVLFPVNGRAVENTALSTVLNANVQTIVWVSHLLRVPNRWGRIGTGTQPPAIATAGSVGGSSGSAADYNIRLAAFAAAPRYGIRYNNNGTVGNFSSSAFFTDGSSGFRVNTAYFNLTSSASADCPAYSRGNSLGGYRYDSAFYNLAGSQGPTVIVPGMTTNTLSIVHLRLGGDTGSSSTYSTTNQLNGHWYEGGMGDALIFNRILSVEERQLLEGFLAQKYRTTASVGGSSVVLNPTQTYNITGSSPTTGTSPNFTITLTGTFNPAFIPGTQIRIQGVTTATGLNNTWTVVTANTSTVTFLSPTSLTWTSGNGGTITGTTSVVSGNSIHPYRLNPAIVTGQNTLDLASSTSTYAQNLVAWFDAANVNSLTPVDSTRTAGSIVNNDGVFNWENLGGISGLRLRQATTTNQPIFVTNALNGLPGLRFTRGTPSGSNFPNSSNLSSEIATYNMRQFTTINTNNEYTAFSVFRISISPATNQSIIMLASVNDRPYLLKNNLVEAVVSLVQRVTYDPVLVQNVPYIITTRRVGGQMTVRVFGNNTNYINTGSFANQTTLATSGRITMGGFSATPSTNNDAFEGDIYEFINFRSALTDQAIQQVEGYLAWKWGLQNSLPNTHAYKRVPA